MRASGLKWFKFWSPYQIHTLDNIFQVREVRRSETLQIQYFCENSFFQTQNGSSHPTRPESELPRSIYPRHCKYSAFTRRRVQQSGQPCHFQRAVWRDVGISCSPPLPSLGMWPQVLVQGFERLHRKAWWTNLLGILHLHGLGFGTRFGRFFKMQKYYVYSLFWIAEVQVTEKKNIETVVKIAHLRFWRLFPMSKFKFYHWCNGKC